jgi:hypothetical protein
VGVCKDVYVDDSKRRRESELKHWRVAMCAAMGFVTPEYFKFRGYLSPSVGPKFEDMPSGLAAIGKVPEESALESELGVQAPVGHRDPVGKDGDIGARGTSTSRSSSSRLGPINSASAAADRSSSTPRGRSSWPQRNEFAGKFDAHMEQKQSIDGGTNEKRAVGQAMGGELQKMMKSLGVGSKEEIDNYIE